jgi:hypothetical protein
MKITTANCVRFASIIARPDRSHINLCFDNRESIVKAGTTDRNLSAQKLAKNSGASLQDCYQAIDFLTVLEFIAMLAETWNNSQDVITGEVTFSEFVQTAAQRKETIRLGHEARALIEKFYAECAHEMHRSIIHSISM